MSLLKLSRLADNKQRLILGTMSGTSIDGLDMALCSFSGHGRETQARVLHYHTVSYNNEQRTFIRNLASSDVVNMQDVALGHTLLAHWHAEMIKNALHTWGVDASEVDLIASHGQTVRHAPRRIHQKNHLPNATLQLGDADHLAYLTGIPTVSDFRQKHIVAGGEGAPLACYGDKLLFSKEGELRILLNIGGISNITVLDGNALDDHIPLTFDTGPGNTLMDVIIQKERTDLLYDANGEIASDGVVNQLLLKELKAHRFFSEKPPKTTGPELLSESYVQDALKRSGLISIGLSNLIATLNRFTAETIAEAVETFVQPKSPFKVYVSGGGVHNAILMQNLKACFAGNNVVSFEETGVNPDAKEALLFAVMANELICGNKLPVLNDEGHIKHVRLGRLSFAD
ncbi:MAG: anhydro-N-acetylmuramic acid kinase [Balneolales bacterium]|nr:anhydro-N-acetylmuramic acid kinase [Balneolales bacterium]